MFLFWPEALEKFLDDHHCFRLATALNIFKTVCHMPIAKTDVQGERADRYKAEDKEALETLHRREQLLEKRMAIEMKTEKHTSAELEELNILDSELKVLKAKYWKHQDEMYQLQYDTVFYQPYMWRIRRAHLIRQWKAKKGNKPVTMWPKDVRACKARGGCCVRQCGCCFRPRSSLIGAEDVYSHCTKECKCCVHYFNLP
ncbi:hypothetical protein CIHG_05302 [Coccidioides immitis H538.4]|uniref:Uncharacterized protein n=3 Tax=Coccidioides immitis TaxID=5501 RepID=A0A0J8R4P7_COCIT|nr:hypothetical protein CIRG_08377 [Coccidioides immitis RMSCC 2394]KMU78688.1 hypothetical protein CISG_01728 [Coccidioides immitis RMSCC 3703]KMU87506.1 hypothetical protein CIHG_05302 [Coccidioides immitis H538.4]